VSFNHAVLLNIYTARCGACVCVCVCGGLKALVDLSLISVCILIQAVSVGTQKSYVYLQLPIFL